MTTICYRKASFSDSLSETGRAAVQPEAFPSPSVVCRHSDLSAVSRCSCLRFLHVSGV
jgi:hypothetical protein